MAAILQCPVCGRLPKIKCKDTTSGYCVHITCKSLFGKVHEQALVYNTFRDSTYKEAFDLWNTRVKYYKERETNGTNR